MSVLKEALKRVKKNTQNLYTWPRNWYTLLTEFLTELEEQGKVWLQ